MATRDYHELLAEATVQVRLRSPLVGVTVSTGGRLTTVSLSDGSQVPGRCFIDASYEGDLMALAQVPYAVGRESIDTYGESLAGVRFVNDVSEVMNSKRHALARDEVWEIDLRAPGGGLVEGVLPADGITVAQGDNKVMNYHFRLIVTRSADRIPFERPADYRPERFELLARYLRHLPETRLTDIVAFLNHPNGQYTPGDDGFTQVTPGQKWELNNKQSSILSLGHLRGQFGYPDGSAAQRAAIVDDHRSHNAGLLYFLAHSEDVPAALRAETQEWGLAADELVDNGHWPYQPYIRETRRMKGAYILIQQDVLIDRAKPDVIYWNSHWIDSHHVQRLALDDHHFRNEGRIWKELVEPYAVPYRALTPRPEHAINLLVPGCVSASHVAFCSIRLESTWMGLGEAAGLAAVAAVNHDQPVQLVDVAVLQRQLSRRGVNQLPH